jgi:hypothetical protein
MERAGDIIFPIEKKTKINAEQNFFVHQRIVTAFKRLEVLSDRKSYIILRGRRCNIIVLDALASSEEKSDNLKDL